LPLRENRLHETEIVPQKAVLRPHPIQHQRV
jgi:hypothetical protein